MARASARFARRQADGVERIGIRIARDPCQAPHHQLAGANKGQSNQSRFDLPAWNALYEKAKVLRHSPERDLLYREMDKLFFAYAPLKPLAHRVITGLAHPWLVGYRRNPVKRDFWQYLDIDESALPGQHARAGAAAAGPGR